MKSDRNILIAFLLNLLFSVVEFIGGIWTGSVAIASDAIHDMGDAASIGLAYILERKSKKAADEQYTYGHMRFSVIGGLITTIILIVGSILVIYNSVERLINPIEINYSGMIGFAIAGTIINFLAAYFTKDGHSVNQKAVNLHMIEDVLGWIVVLIGAIVMKFTDFVYIDSIMSIGVALFILFNACKTLKDVFDILLEKAPQDFEISHVIEHVTQIPGVEGVHHMHLWSIDGRHHCATMHIVVKQYKEDVKTHIKEALHEHGIIHTTIEMELPEEHCADISCKIETSTPHHHHHNHHHHH